MNSGRSWPDAVSNEKPCGSSVEEAFGGGPLLHLPMNMPVSAALLLIAWLMLSASTCMHMETPAADTRMRVSLALGGRRNDEARRGSFVTRQSPRPRGK